jgi:hypothetical protein
MSEFSFGKHKPRIAVVPDFVTTLPLTSELANRYYILTDENENIKVMPVVGINPITGRAQLPINIQDPTTSANIVAVLANTSGTFPGSTTPGLVVAAAQYVRNILLGLNEIQRTPTTFMSAVANTAAATAIRTPTAGKKFRIMAMIITSTGYLAAAAESVLTFLDAAAAITLSFTIWLPLLAGVIPQVPIPVDLKPNGYLSSTVNNVLNLTLTANLAGGHIGVQVWGTEE